jgi:flagellar biogenesis protein FliO
LPEVGTSALRVLGGLALVLAVFFGGVWCFKHWQRNVFRRGPAPKLKVLEARPLGSRQTLYLVAYERKRLLIASAPAGVALLSPLPDAEPGEEPVALPSFAESLQQALSSRS